MSGTSADAVDAVLIECDGHSFTRVSGVASRAYGKSLRHRLLELGRGTAPVPLETLCEMDALVAEVFADAVLDLLKSSRLPPQAIEAIGSHGQTVFHRGGDQPLTLQLGDGGLIAERTGITTVADFRRRDIALGGQGAPLVPAFHHAVFASALEPRAVLNLGGIANLTLLPDDTEEGVRGFDTGPGNALLDDWSLQTLAQPFDSDGQFASCGTVDPALLDALLDDPYFARPAPKSTGRGDFHIEWARRRHLRLSQLAPADVQATFAELTARTVVEALQRHQPQTRRLLVCGGGTRNPDLMRRIGALAWPGLKIETTAAYHLEPQAVEGAAFAWLAMRALDRATGNLPSVTGAKRATVLGAIYPGLKPAGSGVVNGF
jgi:anhydro-N-acetylmuramic acid kinase